jgi:N-acetylneuraminic acid mutarotase
MIFLFGGTDDEERLNDLYAYNIRANSWEKLSVSNQQPLPRSGARGVAYMDGLYFFGGY